MEFSKLREITVVVFTRLRRRVAGFGAELFAMQVALIIVVAAVFTSAAATAQVALVRDDAEDDIRALAISAASLPTVVEGLRSDDPTSTIQPVMDALRLASGVEYITVVDMHGIRVSHPDRSQIGRPVSTDHSQVRLGHEFVGTEEGTLGVTFRAKVPVRDAAGAIIGTLSVGMLESDLARDVADRTWQLVGVALAAVIAGSLLSWVATRMIRRRLYGVDPRELRTLLQTREGMIAGVSDGFVAVDASGRVALANRAAEDMLGVRDILGRDAASALPVELAPLVSGPTTVMTDAAPQRSQLRLGDRSLVVTLSTAEVGGRPAGVTLLFQNRTELERALADLDAQTARADAMRRETHEFENRMHVIAGLLGMGEIDEAARMLDTFPAGSRPGVRDDLTTVRPPVLAALLEARMASAARCGVTLAVSDDTIVEPSCACDAVTITIVGNLLSNAVEAAASRVEVYLSGDEAGLEIRVEDDGPGVPVDDRRRIFVEGVSTKPATGAGRGVGLHLLAGIVAGRGGTIEVADAELGGAAFDVWLPAGDGSAGPLGGVTSAPGARRASGTVAADAREEAP
ncbi:ATP-binding protein [Pseudoclavibacter endophyticus]|nr:sensor histidine kinase [Pseudoclavibacter endophyticus]